MKSNFLIVKNMLVSGVNNLYNYYPQIDKLNVFPVPDGDTGTNMNLTCTNGYNEIIDMKECTIKELLSKFARCLIMGARGNSGVIFSQIIKGISVGVSDVDTIGFNVDILKLIFKKATEFAYKAVMKPVEGTILTVIRETSEYVDTINSFEKENLTTVLQGICDAANKSLENTPNLLPMLKEVGVVDSGGFGLVKFIEGAIYYQKNRKIIAKLKKLDENTGNNLDIILDGDSEFGYCTEAIVMLEKAQLSLDINTIRNTLQAYENTSIVAVIDDDILKIHTHAPLPGQVLTYLQQFGEFYSIKVENMTLQSDKHVIGGNPHSKGKKATVPKKSVRKLENSIATIAVARSKEMADYFKNELNIDYTINGGDKMNPSTKDFLEAIEKVDAKVVYIFPNDSNIFLAVQQAKKEEKKSKIIIIESKSIVEGMSAYLNLDPSESPKNNITNLNKVMKNLTTFSIAKAAKDANMDGVQVKEGNYFSVVNKKINYSAPSIDIIFKKSLTKFITSKSEIITIFVGADAQHSDVVILRKLLDDNYDVEYEIVETQHSVYSFIIGIE
ncbi:DAK2 domain-containing protein [Spiroplasma endosymbiont of Aspidapion aeneum]|uniref:DAK2 domain-containing protein n=1 Tax=Spiroplasma endosymbiont of Aspidapion aeneum TaxID=3066276 RepID=UPI00313E0F1A